VLSECVMMVSPVILVTGVNGLVGTALSVALSGSGRVVHGAVRSAASVSANFASPQHIIGDNGPTTHWKEACAGIDCIVHLAARTHALQDSRSGALSAYRRINVEGTKQLAHAAARSGVRRLVFLSSIKVNGEWTADRAFTEADSPRPEDAYGISKWEAEQALACIARETQLEVVVVRSPLVYGPGVKGNFLRLLRLVSRAAPLPLASVNNRRSLIHVGNLVEAVISCIDSPAAAGNTYLVSDGEDVSTPQLIRILARALGVPPRIFPFPTTLLELGAAMLGKRGEVTRLTRSLQVDSLRIRTELGWKPRFTLGEGLEQTARWYRALPADAQ
jgi:nucleoside-diphosphate-sugar epimerase